MGLAITVFFFSFFLFIKVIGVVTAITILSQFFLYSSHYQQHYSNLFSLQCQTELFLGFFYFTLVGFE